MSVKYAIPDIVDALELIGNMCIQPRDTCSFTCLMGYRLINLHVDGRYLVKHAIYVLILGMYLVKHAIYVLILGMYLVKHAIYVLILGMYLVKHAIYVLILGMYLVKHAIYDPNIGHVSGETCNICP